MTATKELRAMLDRFGLEHFDGTNLTMWVREKTSDGTSTYRYSAFEVDGKFVNVEICRATPAEAVEATLGRGECHLTREAGSYILWTCDECGSYHEHMSEYPWEFCPRCGRRSVKR